MTYTSDDWKVLADVSLAFNRELRKITPPDWAEDWHQALLEETALFEQAIRSIAISGIFAAIAFNDAIEKVQTRLNDLARDYASFCPDFAAMNEEFGSTDATPTPLSTAPRPTVTMSVPLVAAAEFDFEDQSSDGQFHIKPGIVQPVTELLVDSLYDKELIPRGKFVFLLLEMTNIDTEPASFYSKSSFLLRDAKGRAFSPDSDATRTLMFDLDLYEDVFQPGLTYDVVLVWDVAPDATGFHLEIKDTTISVPVDSAAPSPTPTPVPTRIGSSGSPSAGPAVTISLDLNDIHFNPTQMTIPANTRVTITMTNQGVTIHNFTVPDLNITSGDVAPGETKTITFNSGPVGQHQYVCTVPGHTEAGMVGTMTVK